MDEIEWGQTVALQEQQQQIEEIINASAWRTLTAAERSLLAYAANVNINRKGSDDEQNL